MLPSDWCDQNRFISASSSSEPGRWRTSRTPYIKEPLNNLSPLSPVTRTTLMKGHQVSYTQGILINSIAYTIGHQPRSCLLVTPSQKHTQKFFFQKIEPMIIDSPAVREKLSTQSKFAMRNTTFHKDFSGGFLSGIGANVASDLAGASVQILLLDEVDRMVFDVESEGSPVELAVARTAIYRRKKIFLGSTPVNEENSVVLKWFLEGDQRYFFVPCPHCGHFQTLEIERLEESSEGPVFTCEKCTKKIPEKYKTMMLDKGEWRPTATPIDPSYRSYHLSSLYSPVGFLSWSDVLKSQQRAQNDEYFARSFRNLYLGLPTKHAVSEVPTPKELKKRADDAEGGVPTTESMLMTLGVDVQADRVEALLTGFHRKSMTVLKHFTIWGDTLVDESMWDELYDLIKVHGVHLCAIDAGYIPHKVFAFQKKHQDRRIKVIRGVSTEEFIVSLPKFMEVSEHHKRQKRGNKYYHVSTNILKDELYARLMIDDPQNDEFIAFPKGMEYEFYAQVCAERKVLRHPDKEMDRSGIRNPYKWIATRHRNEALDMMVYCLSMYYFSGAAKRRNNWDTFIQRRNDRVRS